MQINLNSLKAEELDKDRYVVKIPKEIIEEGYNYVNSLLLKLRDIFPNKIFVFMPKDINFEELDDETLNFFIETLNKIKDSRQGDSNE